LGKKRCAEDAGAQKAVSALLFLRRKRLLFPSLFLHTQTEFTEFGEGLTFY
jgi:hypothetical protein